MSLKDIDEIKRDIDNWDPRDPMSLRPIKEVSRSWPSSIELTKT